MRGPNSWSWTSENFGFSSQTTQREGDSDCEGLLRRGNSRDDLGDGGSHEEVFCQRFVPLSQLQKFHLFSILDIVGEVLGEKLPPKDIPNN